MSEYLPRVYLARHGETAWSLSGQHTGTTDIPLTGNGERNARQLGERLKGLKFAEVFTSPLQRARRTCDLAGFGSEAVVEPNLAEWNYGDYEGLRTVEIRQQRPDWNLFRDGCPGGESVEQISSRADRAITRVRAVHGDALLFAHGHILRVLAARWFGLPGSGARYFGLGTAALSILGYEHDLQDPVIQLWNSVEHVMA